MNPSTMLNLRDIHLPESVSWWPPAPGWWLLLLFAILLMVVLIWLVKRWNRPRLDKRARAEIDKLYQQYQTHGDQQLYLQKMSILLRRIGMSYLPRNEAAGLSGDAWFEQLNRLAKDKKIDQACVKTLSKSTYQKHPDLDKSRVEHLHLQLSDWASGLAER